MDILYNKQHFLNLLQCVQRQGISQLNQYLCDSDFFTAPASVKYHDSYEGGLCQHSLNVYRYLVKLDDFYKTHLSKESMIIVGLLHDLCKVDFYVPTKRNQRIDGKWQEVDTYTYNDDFPCGHGEKSVFRIMQFIKLNKQEILAINWHMGAYDVRADQFNQLDSAYRISPLTFLLHQADMSATYMGVENEAGN
jgi:hypothetical protein